MKLALIHLSDIHLKKESDPILKRGSELASALRMTVAIADNIVILITGDIAFSGKPEEYQIASRFFRYLRRVIETCSR